VRPRPIPGVEIRECRPRGGGIRYSYRVRFQNARGERTGRTFDCAHDAMDFRARLRLLKRAGDLGVLESGKESLEQLMGDFWRLYVETRLEPGTRRKYRCLWNKHSGGVSARWSCARSRRWFSRSSFSNSSKMGWAYPRSEVASGCCRVFARPDGAPWHNDDWRNWRSRAWQPACEAVGLATITNTTVINDGKRKAKRTYDGPVPYDYADVLVMPMLLRRGCSERFFGLGCRHNQRVSRNARSVSGGR
jgi:hypothetical protein